MDYDINSLVVFMDSRVAPTQSNVGPYVVQIWSRHTLDLRDNKTLVLHRVIRSCPGLHERVGHLPNLGKERDLSRAQRSLEDFKTKVT